jgi:uncharacterized heparinase superfamily protein
MRTRQLAGRPRRLIPARVLAVGLRESEPPDWRPLAGGLGAEQAPQSGPVPPPEQSGTFTAVGASRAFADTSAFWSPDADGLLFAFGLHGFAELPSYLVGTRSPEADVFWRAVVRSWLRRCGEPQVVAWHPFPTSRRIVSLLAALSADGLFETADRQALTRSLWRQGRYLSRCVEHDIGGNHVLHNAIALTWAGTCLGDERLARRGTRLLRRELASQILADGGHEERSPSYHRAVLEQLRDTEELLARAGRPSPEVSAATLQMTAFLDRLAGPDGGLPLLNDAWEGPPWPGRSGASSDLMAESGYVTLRAGESQAVIDAGPLAPSHLPAHAHADALSFVLWRAGRPLLVDPGTYTYAGPERDAYRGTAAHNTVAVDGRDQCTFWGPFRAAHLPTVEGPELELLADGVAVVRGRHDGYARSGGDHVIHERTWCWLEDDGIVVVDRLLARDSHRVASRLHLAPGVDADAGEVGGLSVTPLGALTGRRVEPGSIAPYFGREVPIAVLVAEGDVAPGAPFGWALVTPGVHVRLASGLLEVARPGRQAVALDVFAAR